MFKIDFYLFLDKTTLQKKYNELPKCVIYCL